MKKDSVVIDKELLELLWLASAVFGWMILGFMAWFEVYEFLAFMSMYGLFMGAYWMSKRDK